MPDFHHHLPFITTLCSFSKDNITSHFTEKIEALVWVGRHFPNHQALHVQLDPFYLTKLPAKSLSGLEEMSLLFKINPPTPTPIIAPCPVPFCLLRELVQKWNINIPFLSSTYYISLSLLDLSKQPRSPSSQSKQNKNQPHKTFSGLCIPLTATLLKAYQSIYHISCLYFLNAHFALQLT